MLSKFGHCVSFCDEMLKPDFEDDKFDLIIVDDFFSKDSGFIFLEHLSKEKRSKTIFISSSEEDQRKRFRAEMELFEVIEKPLTSINLAVIVCDFFISSNVDKDYLVTLASN